MGNILYVLVVILVIGWLLAKFVFGVVGGLIHILLIVAVVVLLFKLLSGSKRV